MCQRAALPAIRLARVEVRSEANSDRWAIRAVHLAAFGEHHAPVVPNLVDALRDAVKRGEGLSLVAEERDQLVGHVMFSPSLLDAPRRLLPVQVLSPVGVVPAHQKQGVGTALIRRGLELLSERDVPLVFLGRGTGVLLALRVRARHSPRIQEALVANPGRSLPSAPTPCLRALDDGHARV